MKKQGKAYILLPLVAIDFRPDGGIELMFGWFTFTWSIIF
jgi:hypothetical protein